MSLQENIKTWVSLDNEVRRINKKLQEIKSKKNEINDNILNYFHENNINAPTINISDGKLQLIETKQANALTYKFLEECLNDYFKDEKETEKLINFIKSKRSYNLNQSLKRFYNEEK
jgi:hypothetical protein